jgi:DNA-binding HxlR family transcriptional regulator
MVILDALGRRWALRVLWELRGGPETFRALRERCEDVSPAVLNDRLAELRELGLVEASDAGYALSDHGRELGEILLALDAWARRWARGRR